MEDPCTGFGKPDFDTSAFPTSSDPIVYQPVVKEVYTNPRINKTTVNSNSNMHKILKSGNGDAPNNTNGLVEKHVIKSDLPDESGEELVFADDQYANKIIMTPEEIRDTLVMKYGDIYQEDIDLSIVDEEEQLQIKTDIAFFANKDECTRDSQQCIDTLLSVGLTNSYAISISIDERANPYLMAREKQNLKIYCDDIYKCLMEATTSREIQGILDRFVNYIVDDNKVVEIMEFGRNRQAALINKRASNGEMAYDRHKMIPVKKQLTAWKLSILKRSMRTTKGGCSISECNPSNEWEKRIDEEGSAHKSVKGGKDRSNDIIPSMSYSTFDCKLMILPVNAHKTQSLKWRTVKYPKMNTTGSFHVNGKFVASSTINGVDVHKIPSGKMVERYSVPLFGDEYRVSIVSVSTEFVTCTYTPIRDGLLFDHFVVFDRISTKVGIVTIFDSRKKITSVLQESRLGLFWIGLSDGVVMCIPVTESDTGQEILQLVMGPRSIPVRRIYRKGRKLYCMSSLGVTVNDVVPLKCETILNMQKRSDPSLLQCGLLCAFDRWGQVRLMFTSDHMLHIMHESYRALSRVISPPKSLYIGTVKRKDGTDIDVFDQARLPLHQFVSICRERVVILYSNSSLRIVTIPVICNEVDI